MEDTCNIVVYILARRICVYCTGKYWVRSSSQTLDTVENTGSWEPYWWFFFFWSVLWWDDKWYIFIQESMVKEAIDELPWFSLVYIFCKHHANILANIQHNPVHSSIVICFDFEGRASVKYFVWKGRTLIV